MRGKKENKKVTDNHQRVDEVLAAFAKGEIVVVTDDDDRENEGDLFVAASLCTPEKMAFIIRNTSGIVCAPLSADEARRLRLCLRRRQGGQLAGERSDRLTELGRPAQDVALPER